MNLHLHTGYAVIGADASFAYISQCYLTWGVGWKVPFYVAFPEIVRLGIIAKVRSPGPQQPQQLMRMGLSHRMVVNNRKRNNGCDMRPQ